MNTRERIELVSARADLAYIQGRDDDGARLRVEQRRLWAQWCAERQTCSYCRTDIGINADGLCGPCRVERGSK